MENTLLIGLSRQMMLERQIDVIANNVANVNTNGYKADRSLFEEYLMPGAHEDNFVGPDRRLSFVQDRATFHDFKGGPTEQTKSPLDVAIDSKAFLVVQTPNGERYTRNGGLQINAQGQLVTASGYPVLGSNGPISFQQTDRDITISADGTVTVIEGINNATLHQQGGLAAGRGNNFKETPASGPSKRPLRWSNRVTAISPVSATTPAPHRPASASPESPLRLSRLRCWLATSTVTRC